MTVFKLKRKTTLVTMNDEIENTDDDFYVTVPSEKKQRNKKTWIPITFNFLLVAFIRSMITQFLGLNKKWLLIILLSAL